MKLDDYYLSVDIDDLSEPLPLTFDSCLPKVCNVQVRTRPVVDEAAPTEPT